MRENCTYGSEGGEGEGLSLPLSGAGEFDIPAKAGIHVSFTHTVCLSAFHANSHGA